MQAINRLEIQGSIAIDQFWPQGKSDADTSKVLLKIAPGAIRIRLAGASQFVRTRAYDDAVLITGKNKDGTPKAEPVIKKNMLTIRLQRIDAPELHYPPDARGSGGKLKGTGLFKDYRQWQAESATLRLGAFLKKLAKGKPSLACTFVSELRAKEGPNAAIDRYGRFVGDLILPDGTNLNLWLLEHGLAVIALYESMLDHEIRESLASWQRGRKLAAGIARHYDRRFRKFEGLTFRPPPGPPAREGSKRFLHPKFFRRQTTWWVFAQADIFAGDFSDWLEQKAERCWYLPEFLVDGTSAPSYLQYERAADGKQVGWAPEDFIFEEASSAIKRPIGPGKYERVKTW